MSVETKPEIKPPLTADEKKAIVDRAMAIKEKATSSSGTLIG